MKLVQDLPELDDLFKSIELRVRAKHVHTGVAVPEHFKIQALELGDKDLTLEIPPKTFTTGHYLHITIDALNTPKKFKTFETHGKIEELKSLEGADQVRIALSQFDPAHWQELRNLFTARQAEIEQFFASTRGY